MAKIFLSLLVCLWAAPAAGGGLLDSLPSAGSAYPRWHVSCDTLIINTGGKTLLVERFKETRFASLHCLDNSSGGKTPDSIILKAFNSPNQPIVFTGPEKPYVYEQKCFWLTKKQPASLSEAVYKTAYNRIEKSPLAGAAPAEHRVLAWEMLAVLIGLLIISWVNLKFYHSIKHGSRRGLIFNAAVIGCPVPVLAVPFYLAGRTAGLAYAALFVLLSALCLLFIFVRLKIKRRKKTT